jgi:hypothetical protein
VFDHVLGYEVTKVCCEGFVGIAASTEPAMVEIT